MFASNLLQQVLAFATVLGIAKLLSPSDFALVRISQAYISVLLIVGAGGVTAPVLRYCADAQFDGTARRALLGHSLKVVFVTSLLVTAVSLMAALARYTLYTDEQFVFVAYALQLPAVAATSVFFVYLQAIQEFRRLAVSQVWLKMFSLVVILSGAFWYGLYGLLIAAGTAAWFGVLVTYRLTSPVFQLSRSLAVPKDYSSLARYSVFGMLVSALGQSSDLILLDAVGADKNAIGAYSLACVFLLAAGVIVGTAQSMATPAFTALIKQPEKFRKQLKVWSVAMFAASVPVALGLVALAWVLERWFFAAQYDGFSQVLALLMIKFCLWSTYAIGGAALVGAGAIRKGSWVAVITTILAFVAGFPMCAEFGIWGAAWTQVAVALVSFVLVWWVIREELKNLTRNQNFHSTGSY